MSRGYLIGENLKDRIHETIERVSGLPYGAGAGRVEPRLDSSIPVAAGNTITVKISQNWPTLDHTPLAVGHGIAVPLGAGGGPKTRIATDVDEGDLVGTSSGITLAASESAIPAFSSSLPELRMESDDRNVLGGTRCGVITSVADEVDEDGYWVCRVQIRGVVKCRVLMLQGGNSVIPPPPYPELTNLRQYWRRYLTIASYGFSTLIGVGAYRSLISPGTTNYPAVAEAAVFLG